jgi:hypothetical protein
MKVIAILLACIASFWSGYYLASSRAYGIAFPEFSRSRDLANASLLVRFTDLIDKGDIAPLRAKLLAVAKIMVANPAPVPAFDWKNIADWKGLALGPFDGSVAMIDSMHRETEARASTVRGDIMRLCQNAPITETYKYVCDR